MPTAILSLALLCAVGAEVETKAERETYLYVTSSPAGAEVLVDGQRVGTTPGLFPFKPGVRRVIVELEGHDEHGQDVTIRAGDIKRLTLRLKRRAAAGTANVKLGPGATHDAIVAWLKDPPEGWDFVELMTASHDVSSKGPQGEMAPKQASRVVLSGHGKRLEVGVFECVSREHIEQMRKSLLVTVLLSEQDGSLLTRAKLPTSDSLSCATFDKTLVTFSGDGVDPLFAARAARELGFEGKLQIPLWADLAKQRELRQQENVRLVVGKEKLTLEGRPTTWQQLPELLATIPNRLNTGLNIARTADDWDVDEWRILESRILAQCRIFGFKSSTFIGEYPLGSHGTRYVRLVIAGAQNMTVEGRKVQENSLVSELLSVPDRYRATLQFARASDAEDEMDGVAWMLTMAGLSEIATRLGYKDTAYIGDQPLGSTAPTEGGLIGVWSGHPSARVEEVHLPDADTPRAKNVLDLASGETFRFPEMGDPPDPRVVTRQGKGDLFFDDVLGCLRGAKAMRWDGERFVAFPPKKQLEDASGYELPALPCRLLITTAEKKQFDVIILSTTEHDGGIDLTYREADPAVVPIPVDPPGAAPVPPRLNEVFKLIERNYVVGIERPELAEAAIQGILEGLDEHSEYLDRAELTALREQLAQQLSGVGLAIRFDDEARELRVISPLHKMPAYRAGVRAGDTIVQIDGMPADKLPRGKELTTAVVLLRGKPGTSVTVGLKHAGFDEVEQVEIVREVIRMPAVLGDVRKPNGDWQFMLDEDRKIGYVRLSRFDLQATDQLKAALDELTSRGMKAFVLDLRNSPGGSLVQAVKVADLFVEDGVIVSVKDREGPGKKWSATKEGTLGKFPMAVLVNRDSAGAAEIVAACLQDHRRAVIVGERTYGKGTAHKILELKSGNGALKLPTALFLRPNGKNIHRFDGAEEMDVWGVLPDEQCEVVLSQEEYRQLMENRRQRDVYDPEKPANEFEDQQLQKAIERL